MPPEDGDEEDDGDDEEEEGDATDIHRHRRNLLQILEGWNEIEKISRDEKNRWLEEIGRMFQWLRAKDNFVAILLDDHFPPEDKLAEYNRQMVVYKFMLDQREDVAKVELFKKMLDDMLDFYKN